MAKILQFGKTVSNVFDFRQWARTRVIEKALKPETAAVDLPAKVRVRVCGNCRVTQAADNSNLCSLCKGTGVTQKVHWLGK